jgi:hypothetical protein
MDEEQDKIPLVYQHIVKTMLLESRGFSGYNIVLTVIY